MKYFIVTAKCGHVGRSNCILVDFPVAAEDAKSATGIARNFGRVKHHHKDAIKDVRETDIDGYIAQMESNDRDPYLHCRNVQEQRKIGDIASRIVPDDWNRRRLFGDPEGRRHDPEFTRMKNRVFAEDGLRQIREFEEELFGFCS